MRRASRIALVLVAAFTSACFTYRTVRTAPAPRSSVRVVLLTNTAVIVADPAGARSTVPEVLELHGIVEAAAADTIAVRLGELRTARGPVAGMEGRVALLSLDRVDHMTARRFEAGRTALGGIGIATLAVGAFLVVLIVTLTNGF